MATVGFLHRRRDSTADAARGGGPRWRFEPDGVGGRAQYRIRGSRTV